MAAPTYKAQCIVLRKTKLGEKDLIVTLLSENGSLIKAVAKGARKPGGSHAAKLDLFSVVEGLFAKGKSLDVITESKLIAGSVMRDDTLERTAVSTPVAELLSLIAQEDLEQPRLYALSLAVFERLRLANEDALLALCAAALWKILSQSGFKPSLGQCVICGEPLLSRYDDNLTKADGDNVLADHTVKFSPLEGGVICDACMASADAFRVDAQVIAWCDYLIMSRLDQIEAQAMEPQVAFALLSLARTWTRVHIGKDIRSLDFLVTSGLFEDSRKE